VTNVTSSLADGTYGVGQVVPVQVTFSEAVTVTGTPQLTLSTGSPATTAVNYSSGSGTNTLTFNYTVAAGNTSPDLDYASVSALALNGGTIKDAATNNATLTLASPGTAGSLGFNKAIVITTTSPKIDQTINFPAIADRTMPQSPFTPIATATSGLPVSFSSSTTSVCTATGTRGTTIKLVGTGLCTLTASQGGDATYNPAPSVQQSFNVTKANQTISAITLSAGPNAKTKIASATSDSGLAVSFTTTTPSVCTAGGNKGSRITIVSSGNCHIVATQGGDSNYNPAPPVAGDFAV
jgi:hypothetical protein